LKSIWASTKIFSDQKRVSLKHKKQRVSGSLKGSIPSSEVKEAGGKKGWKVIRPGRGERKSATWKGETDFVSELLREQKISVGGPAVLDVGGEEKD